MNRFEALLDRFPSPVSILDAGCGDCPTARTYRTRWAQAQIVGVDRNLEMLEQAHRFEPSIHWLCADLNHLPFTLRPLFDLILVRHPDVDRARESWDYFLVTSAPALLLPNGHLVVTAYTPLESDSVQGRLRSVTDLRWVTVEALPPPDLAGHDARVLVYLKEPQL